MSQLQVEPQVIVAWAILAAIPLLLWRFTLYVRRRGAVTLRPIAAFDALRGLMGRVAEQGKRVHLSLGRSGIGGEQTPTVAAGLSVLRAAADEGAAFGEAPVVTVADPIALIAAQDAVYRAHRERGQAVRYVDTDVQLIAPDPTAYVVGACEWVDAQETGANVMVGHLGDEYLMLGEPGARRQIVQVAGSDALSAQALMVATTDRVLLGEDLFAAGAYLHRQPALVASLYVQDVLRGLAVVAIVIGVLIKTLAG